DVKVVPSANWNQYPKEFSPGRVTWSFTLPDEILKAKDSASLTLTDFECHTDPVKAELTLRVTVTGYDAYMEKLEVEKKATDALQILFFKADPPLIIKGVTGEDFKLEWDTINAHQVSLLKVNNPVLTLQEGQETSLPSKTFKNGERISYQQEQPSLTMVYKLVAMDRVDKNKQQEKEVTVHVVERGWRRLDDYRASLGNRADLCNLDGLKLYGIWIKQRRGG